MISIALESIEFLPVDVLVDGAVTSDIVKVSVVTAGSRPGTWVVTTTLDGKNGTIISGLAPGIYDVWIQVSDDPETPVILAGSFRIY